MIKRRINIWAILAPDGLLHQSVVVVTVAWLITLMPLNIEFLAPIEIALREFEYTDIITSQIDDDESQRIDTSMVLVNIGYATRTELAMTIDAIHSAGARCIAVDVMFGSKADTTGTDLLASVVRDRPNIIMAEVLTGRVTNADSAVYGGCDRGVLGQYQGITYANVNMPSSSTFKTIRNWEPSAIHGDSVSPSIVLSVARLYLTDTTVLREIGDDLFIKYQKSRTWFTAEWSDCVTGRVDPSVFQGRIVMLGFLGSRLGDTTSNEDRFFTPLNRSYVGRTWPDAYGLEIHATVLSMLLHRDLVMRYGDMYDVIIAFMTTLTVLWIYRVASTRWRSFGETIARFSQIVMLLGIFAMLAILLLDYNRVLPTDISIACAVLCLDIATIYDGTAGSIYLRLRRCSRKIRVARIKHERSIPSREIN